METIKAIATLLKISESKIKTYEEWASVFFVRFVSGRPRFVSKKEVEQAIATRNTQLWVLEWRGGLNVNWRSQVWLSKIVGFHPRYVFERQRVEGKSSLNRRGGKDIEFRIKEPGIYQDSTAKDAFFEVLYTKDGLCFSRFLTRYQVEVILHNNRNIPYYG